MAAFPLPVRVTRGLATIAAPSSSRVLLALAFGALAVSVGIRAYLGLTSPLWLDETWTAAFSSEPTLSAVTGQIRNDVNAPVYYYLMFFWAKAFGLSNLSLRIPGVICSLAAPLVGWAALRRRNPSIALVWCALLALWFPGILLADDARCYGLLILAATLNAWAYLRALEAPTVGRAGLWVASATLAVLVHYHAAFLAVAEAGIFLFVHWRRVGAVWPAALAAVPAVPWLVYHAPRLAAFARPDTAWYGRLEALDVPIAFSFLLGFPTALSLVAIVSLLALLQALKILKGARDDRDGLGVLWLVAAAAFLAATTCVVVGLVRPSFTFRYVAPFAPGALLGLACVINRLGRDEGAANGALIIGFVAFAVLWIVQIHPQNRVYSFERASAFLAQARPDRLVYFWDHPDTKAEAPDQLDLVGGFFLRRAGHPVVVKPLYQRPLEDMSKAAVQAAGAHGGVLWLYDTMIHDTLAKAQPPRIADLDPGFECRNFGAGTIGVIACRRKAAR